MIAIDTETHLIRPGLISPPIVCGSWATAQDKGIVDPAELLAMVEKAFRDKEMIAGANVAYDFGVIAARAPRLLDVIFDHYEQGLVWDVQIAQALDAIAGGHLFQDPVTHGPLKNPVTGKISRRYSLDICCVLTLGKCDAKTNDTWRLRYAELDGKPIATWPEEAKQYSQDDARNTFDVAKVQYEGSQFKNVGFLERHDLSHQEIHARAAWAMHLASMWGIRTDLVSVKDLSERIEADYVRGKDRFTAVGILRSDGTQDGAVLKRLIAKAYGSKISCVACSGTGKNEKNTQCKKCSASGLLIASACPLTEKGAISTSRDTLEESGDELLEAYAAASEDDKIRETYIPFLREGTSVPINPRGNVLVASGRASYDGLIQLIPRSGGVRECFVSRPGYVFCSTDYAALELCTLAQVCLWVAGQSRMAEEINAGRDLHAQLAASLSGVSIENFEAKLKSEDPAEKKKAKDLRQMAKAANFGFPGGMGAAKFVLAKRKEGLRLCLASGKAVQCGASKITEYKARKITPTCAECLKIAEELRAAWFNQWPEVTPYFEWINREVGQSGGQGKIKSPGTGFVRGGLDFSNAANHCFQHLAAMGAKHALWKVSKECYTDRSSPLFGSRPVIFVHDEIFCEMPEDRAHEAGPRLAEIMIEAMREFVPDVTIRAEPALMRRWTKAAEPKHDAKGRLIPWD